MKKTLTQPRGKAIEETPLNAGVPAELHTRIRVRAAQEGVTVKSLVTTALQRFLDGTKTRADSAA